MNTMAAYGYPILFTAFVWWFSTGVIVYLDGLPRRTFRWSMLGATALSLGALYSLTTSATDTTVTSAYVAFTCAIMVWGWNEMGFLMGYVTGPRPAPCPAGAVGFERFSYATMAILYHELALVASLALIAGLTWDQPNQVGVWTFAVLWVLRLSSKINVFLGVPNLTEEFLPQGLSFLKSYFRKAPMNVAFPISISLSTTALVVLAQQAIAVDVTAFQAAAFTFVCALLALAILEHWLMVLPLPAAALWSWGLTSHNATSVQSAHSNLIEPISQATVTAAARLKPGSSKVPAVPKVA